jgi:hypothetical protein
MKNYLFLSINNIRGRFTREPELNDPYIMKAIDAFTAVNPSEHFIRSDKKLDWDENNPVAKKIDYTHGRLFQQVLDRELRPRTRKTCFGTLRSRSRSSKLQNINPNDCLFIVGHGSYLKEFLARKHVDHEGQERVNDVYLIHASLLATILELSGLKKAHKHIKVNSCFGGGSDAVIPFSELSFEGSAILARKLAVELGTRGYRNILVGGYNYMTFHDGNDLYLKAMLKSKHSNYATPVEIPATRLTDAYKPRGITFEEDPYRIWYNGRGDMVRWNEPDMPADYQKVNMLDPATHPSWADYQKKVREWEEQLRKHNLG